MGMGGIAYDYPSKRLCPPITVWKLRQRRCLLCNARPQMHA